ncbi:MAG: HlyD family efflux transporter periplasmic adaptor subunit [Acidobacteria bacterium]|nr:HlyD family efflux transporter periplasmic adaptor subunit [Acidobacteriota bacterium]
MYRRERRRDPQVGDESQPGQVLLEVVDLRTLQARIYVLERDAGSLAKGQEVLIQLDAIPEKQFLGVIRNVSAMAQSLERNSPLRYFACEVTISDPGEDLRRIRPGMALRADVIMERYESCFVVPTPAVTFRDKENLVYIRQADTFVSKPVEIGLSTHGQITILQGVEEGQMIALRNPFETRKLALPDFSKGAAGEQGGRGGPGKGGMMRMIIH